MWKAPHRPDNRISQTFNDGVVTIYEVKDVSRPGYQPVEALVKKGVLRYEEQRLGVQRFYSAMQAQVKIERVIRVPWNPNVHSQDAAKTEDGRRYEINMVQKVMEVWPACMDLTLVDLTEDYEVVDDE